VVRDGGSENRNVVVVEGSRGSRIGGLSRSVVRGGEGGGGGRKRVVRGKNHRTHLPERRVMTGLRTLPLGRKNDLESQIKCKKIGKLRRREPACTPIREQNIHAHGRGITPSSFKD